ncbi:MAG: glycosyltransferase family 9 protein [Proteobacteria bacterium]|nr:glycosyltransferase family 9 protein [Pseudomonadota bacterium]
MRILFVTSNRVGDAVLSTGLLDHLIRRYPEARITVVCGRVAEGVFARMPNRAATIVLDKRPYGLHWLPLWARMAVQPWSLVVDIRGSALSWLVPTLRRAVWRRRPGHKIAELGAMLGLDPPPPPVAWTAPEDEAAAEALVFRHAGGAPVVALGPTANWPPKAWPADRFAALFAALRAGPLPGAIPAVLAGPGEAEREMAAPLLAALPEAIDLSGRLSLPQAAAVLRRSALYVGNDSGLMHLAAAAGAPTLGLFGPTPADEYAPIGRRAAIVRAPDGTMAGISTEAVLDAARRLLDAEAPAGTPAREAGLRPALQP